MASAGFNVPRGFLVTTSAYRGFVSDNGLQPRIIQLARPSVVENRVSFDAASDNLEALFAASDLAPNVVEEVTSAYRALGDALPVAVRSSANAEDLPELSFAGQQETYLNVRGADQVVAAVRACWASLWTARAINYRHQNGIDQNGVAMAVVVQVMVPSAVSGILFTANPATGERAEMIVNASFGLGEAVVSGEVTPDTYIIDRATGRPKETIIGPKEQKTVSAGNQGTRMEDVSPEERDQACLTDDMLMELTETAPVIEKLYDGLPQGIEWAFPPDGSLSLLQSRPITNLPVQPIEVTWDPTPPAKILYRLWFARKYNHIREETAFYFGYSWCVLRPMAFELGRRMVAIGTFLDPGDTFFLVTEELRQAISARASSSARAELGRIAAERRELREARKRHHGPGTIPAEASNIPTVRFKETQIRNDATSDTLNGFAVSSGTVTAAASVILSHTEFDKMSPETILVAPNTTPAWTQLFSHAVGLVTDMGSILAHGSIVAREYGIPAVLGVGNGTLRIHHGQMLTIDGDAGTVLIHEAT